MTPAHSNYFTAARGDFYLIENLRKDQVALRAQLTAALSRVAEIEADKQRIDPMRAKVIDILHHYGMKNGAKEGETLEQMMERIHATLEAAHEYIATLEAALRALVETSSKYQEQASSYFSDTDYDADGCLAELEAEMTVTALPKARAALSATNPESREGRE